MRIGNGGPASSSSGARRPQGDAGDCARRRRSGVPSLRATIKQGDHFSGKFCSEWDPSGSTGRKNITREEADAILICVSATDLAQESKVSVALLRAIPREA